MRDRRSPTNSTPRAATTAGKVAVMMPASAAAVRLSPSSMSTVKPTMPSSAISARSRHSPRLIRASFGPGSPARHGAKREARHGEAEEHEDIDGDGRDDGLAEGHVGAGERHGGDERQGGETAGRHGRTLAPRGSDCVRRHAFAQIFLASTRRSSAEWEHGQLRRVPHFS